MPFGPSHVLPHATMPSVQTGHRLGLRLRRRAQKLFDHLPLRAQIGLFTAMLCLAMLGAVAGTVGWLAADMARHQAAATLAQAASVVANRIDGAADRDAALNETRQLLMDAGLPPTVRIWAASPDGHLLGTDDARADDGPVSDAVLLAMRFAPAGVATDGKRLLGYALARDDVFVIAAMNRHDVLAPARHMVNGLLAVGGPLALCCILLSMLLGGRLAQPIRQLCEQAEGIGRSADSAKVRWAHGSIEVLRLSRSLRSLVRRLGSAERRLLDATQQADANSQRFARQIETLRRLADTDPLTGLLNRRGFLGAAHGIRSASDAEPSGVLILDIDHFKHVNDRYGHATGDEVIRAVAAAIQGVVRHTDLVARLGGEEFVVAAEGPPDALEALAERLRLATQQVVAATTGMVRVTVSIGGAVAQRGDRDLQDAIDRADAALYRAKQAGRNCVRIQRSRADQRIG